MKYILTIPFVFLFYLVLSNTSFSQSNTSVTNVGVIIDHNDGPLDAFLENILKECTTLLGNSLRFDAANIRYVDWDPTAAQATLEEFLQDDSIDMILGIGVVSSGELAGNGPSNKPILASLVLDPNIQNIPVTSNNTSGVHNLTYVVSPFDFYTDLRTFHDIYPFEKLGIIVDQYVFDQPRLPSQRFGDFMDSLDATYQIIVIDSDPAVALQKMDTTVDAVYLGPAIKMSQADRVRLIEGINEKKLPSFAFIGRMAVEVGILAGLASESDFSRISRRIALNIDRVLGGIDPADLQVTMRYQPNLTINMATARAIGFSPNWAYLKSAELLNEDITDIPRVLSLQLAIREVLQHNWEIAIAEKTVEAGEKQVKEARSSLLPQLDVQASARIIDQDRAAASFGSQPERASYGSAGFSQVLFSENANANLAIAKRQLEATAQERDVTRLDAVLEATEAYLNVLKAKTSERVQQQNVSLNRANMKLAEVRRDVGYSGPSDLYRWKSNLALANINLNNAQATRRAAEFALNQLLNRPLDELFETTEDDLNDPNLLVNDIRLTSFINNPATKEIFTDFLVKEGTDNLPEIQQIDAIIASQQRYTALTRRNFFLPSFGLSANTDYLLNKGGAGSVPPDLGGFGNLAVDDLSWQIGIGASLPLFTGGKRSAQYQRALVETEQLEYQKRNLLNKVEQRIRTAMERVVTSYANIQLSNMAQEASTNNFNLIQDSYAQGTVSIITLIDAQNAAIQAQENQANAGYEFLTDLMNLERAIGTYFIIVSPEEKDAFFQRLYDFVDNNGN